MIILCERGHGVSGGTRRDGIQRGEIFGINDAEYGIRAEAAGCVKTLVTRVVPKLIPWI